MMVFTSAIVALALFSSNGAPRKFVEKVQEVQVEKVYSPTVGRRPEPEPGPLTPVRYLTPEQRAEPIIVDPAPIIISDEEPTAPTLPAPDASAVMDAGSDAADWMSNVPDYITSMPIGEGSATGSTAVAEY